MSVRFAPMKYITLFATGVIISMSAVAKDSISLKDIRQQLLNKEVVILGRAIGGGSRLSGSLSEWHVVKGEGESGFKRVYSNYSSNAPSDILGKRGTVISVEIEDSPLSRSKKPGETDAFGKVIDDSNIIDPYVRVVVKLADDESLVSTTSYYISMLGHSIQLAVRAESLKKEVEGILQRLIGKTLFKAGYTELLDPTLSLGDLLDYNKRKLSHDIETANLTPLSVVDAKLLEAENAVLIKVELPNKNARILFGSLEYFDTEAAYTQTLLQKMQISAEEKIPSKFSRREIAAIKEGKIFRGMSEDALYWSWGYPEKTNDWGRGGKQLIYYGTQYVYLDGKTVRDWQSVR